MPRSHLKYVTIYIIKYCFLTELSLLKTSILPKSLPECVWLVNALPHLNGIIDFCRSFDTI